MQVGDITYLNDGRYPRNIRNNNPGNIRRSNTNWKGKVQFMYSKDQAFEQFTKYWYGVRALIKLMYTYIIVHKLNTIEKIIKKYAPSSENNTDAYIASVEKQTGIPKDILLAFDKDTIYKLILAIAKHEGGKDPMISQELYHYSWDNL